MRLVLAMLVVAVTSARADRISPADLARKNVGGYVTGLPLFAYSTDIGFGGGARAYYYWNGQRDDERFPRTPYLHRVSCRASRRPAGCSSTGSTTTRRPCSGRRCGCAAS